MFTVALGIKVPVFPFHLWLPEVHSETDTCGSVLLAGVLLKVGSYGLMRFTFEIIVINMACTSTPSKVKIVAVKTKYDNEDTIITCP